MIMDKTLKVVLIDDERLARDGVENDVGGIGRNRSDC